MDGMDSAHERFGAACYLGASDHGSSELVPDLISAKSRHRLISFRTERRYILDFKFRRVQYSVTAFVLVVRNQPHSDALEVKAIVVFYPSRHHPIGPQVSGDIANLGRNYAHLPTVQVRVDFHSG